MVAKLPLLQKLTTTYSEEDEVIVKLQLQGMDELLLALKSRNVVVPISSITILEPADIHDEW